MTPSILQPPAHAKKVVSFTVTGEVYKSRDNAGRPCFAADGEYLTECGERSKASVTSQTKKGLPARIASKVKSASNGEITLENGFEVRRFSIG
jgi:hypothetical protein